jgi:hypothetical protein
MSRLSFMGTSLACCMILCTTAHGESAKGRVVAQALPRGEIVTFMNTKSEYCLGVGRGELVKQFKCNGSPSQKWRVEGTGPSQSYKNVKTGKCLGVDGAKITPGANIGQYKCDSDYNAPNQSWSLLGLRGSMVRRIINEKSTDRNGKRFCIGVDWASTKNGAQLKQFPCDDISLEFGRRSNQAWQVSCRNCMNRGP